MKQEEQLSRKGAPPKPEKKKRVLERSDPKGLLDKLVGKLWSRKFMVWGTATFLIFQGQLTSSDWVMVSLVYIGSQAAVDLLTQMKYGK